MAGCLSKRLPWGWSSTQFIPLLAQRMINKTHLATITLAPATAAEAEGSPSGHWAERLVLPRDLRKLEIAAGTQ